jgi:hypothetical protein
LKLDTKELPVLIRSLHRAGRRALTLLATLALLSTAVAPASASAPPPNDDARDAEVVTSVPASFSLDVRAATVEEGEQTNACVETDNTVWYALTLPADQRLQLDATGSDFDAGLVVFAGTGPEDELVACGARRLTFDVQAGVSYFVQVGAVMGLEDGQGWLDLTFREAAQLTGKPTTSNGRSAIQAVLAAWEQELPEGRRLVQVSAWTERQHSAPGRPVGGSDVTVEIHDLVTDPETGILTHDEWFGFLTPSSEQLRLDPALRTAVVDAPVLLEHLRVVVTPDGEAETEDLGVVPGAVSLRWTGQGDLMHDRFVTNHRDVDERGTFVGIQRYRAAVVDGDVSLDGRSVINDAPWISYLADGKELSRAWWRTDAEAV